MKKGFLNSFLNIFSRIKVCYVNIGLRVQALFAKLYCSKQHEGLADDGRGSEARGKGLMIFVNYTHQP